MAIECSNHVGPFLSCEPPLQLGWIYSSLLPSFICRTFKKDCEFSIYVAANKEGSHLEVRSVNLEHNHPVAPQLFQQLPQQRRLPPDLKTKARHLLKLRANKMLVREQMQRESGHAVLLKDLSNISAEGKRADPRNNLPEVVRILQEKHKAAVRLLTDENNELQALYFQDEHMKASFEAYPELIFVDATYKLLDTRMACFLVIIENGNGESEIVAVGLFGREDAETLHWFFEAFKALNPQWEAVRVTMADKDIKERQVVKQQFPLSALHICAFHTLQAFRREVSVLKLGITKGEQETALDILQRMVYANSEEQYQELYSLLQMSASQSVVEYFNENWHSIHAEWVMGLKWLHGNFFNSTNNRAESMNCKLKKLVERFSSLEEFVNSLYSLIATQRNERECKAGAMVQKQRVVTTCDEASVQYSRLLTPYAYDRVKEELDVKKSPATHTDAQKFCTGTDYCACAFRTAMLLPCRHIFAVRDELNMPRFEQALCADRWFLDGYIRSYGSTRNVDHDEAEPLQVATRVDERTLSGPQKYKKAAGIALKLAELAAEGSTASFKDRMKVLETVLESWRDGKEVTVAVVRSPQPLTDLLSGCDTMTSIDATAEEYLSEIIAEPEPSINLPSGPCTNNEVRAHGQSDQGNGEPTVGPLDTLEKIKVPVAMRKCGRPKGQALTVIGLPKKRKRTGEMPYAKLPLREKKIKLLTWLTGAEKAAEAMRGKLLGEETVEQRPHHVPDGIRDECVDVSLTRRFFSDDAWQAVEMVVKMKKEEPWKCHECKTNLHDEKSVMCDWCLCWSHQTCAGLKHIPKTKLWKCRECN